jgi:hypothetical protein
LEEGEEEGSTFDGSIECAGSGDVLDDNYFKSTGFRVGLEWSISERLAGVDGPNCAAYAVAGI